MEGHVFRAREPRFRGTWGRVGLAVFGSSALIATLILSTARKASLPVDDVLKTALCYVAAVLSIVRVAPRTLIVDAERVELRGLFRSVAARHDEVTGVGWAPACGETLRTARGEIPLWLFPGAIQEVWARVLPAVADRIARRLAAGETVALGAIVARMGSFEVKGRQIAWRDVESMAMRPEGWLVTVRDRPDDALVLPLAQFSDVRLLREVAVRMNRLATSPEPDDDSIPVEVEGEASPSPSSPAATPLPGMPAEHPELGRLLFTFRVPLASRIGAVLKGIAATLIFAAIAVWVAQCKADGGDKRGYVAFGLGCALMFVGERLARTKGNDFCVYERGAADRRWELAWGELDSITLSTSNVATVWGAVLWGEVPPDATRHAVSLAGRGDRRFGLEGEGPAVEAFLDWFRRNVVPILVARELGRIRGGAAVDLAGVTLDATGIRDDEKTVPCVQVRLVDANTRRAIERMPRALHEAVDAATQRLPFRSIEIDI
jgi:hypothetical protein